MDLANSTLLPVINATDCPVCADHDSCQSCIEASMSSCTSVSKTAVAINRVNITIK